MSEVGPHGKGFPPPECRVVTSPLGRAKALAGPIAAVLGRDLVVDDRFAEMGFGSWEGVLWDDVPRVGLDVWAENLLGYRGHGGESVGVCHLGVIRAALAARGSGDPWTASVPFGGVVVLPDQGVFAR